MGLLMNPPPQKIVGLKLCWLIFDLNFFLAALSVRKKILVEKFGRVNPRGVLFR